PRGQHHPIDQRAANRPGAGRVGSRARRWMAIAMPALTYVLLPGAGGNAWYWHRVAPELRRRGHEVFAVDLPTGDDRAGLAEYADTVVAAIGDRGNVVLVAQSMAGFSAPLVCDRVPVSMLILVNAMIPRPGETPGEWWEATGQPEASRDKGIRDGRAPDAPFDPLVDFFHDVPQRSRMRPWASHRPRSRTRHSRRSGHWRRGHTCQLE